MALNYDDTFGSLFFIRIPDSCPDCGDPRYDTSCDAPGCTSTAFLCCGTGCDIEVDPEGGRCARAIAAETAEELFARINRERAAFGLDAIPTTQDGENS
jgi:hypothetical protein